MELLLEVSEPTDSPRPYTGQQRYYSDLTRLEALLRKSFGRQRINQLASDTYQRLVVAGPPEAEDEDGYLGKLARLIHDQGAGLAPDYPRIAFPGSTPYPGWEPTGLDLRASDWLDRHEGLLQPQ
ncbi:hypothetical protein ACWDUL_20755 [Nocardia niigatensis]